MGFVKGEGSSLPVTYCELRTDVEAKTSAIYPKDKDNGWALGDPQSAIVGTIEDISVEPFAFSDGTTGKNLIITMVDEQDRFILKIRWNMIAKSILNSLAGVEDLWCTDVMIDPYWSKKNNRASVAVKLGPGFKDRANWKYSSEDGTLPSVEPVLTPSGEQFMVNGRAQWDKSKVEKFFDEVVIPEVKAKLGSAKLAEPSVQYDPASMPSAPRVDPGPGPDDEPEWLRDMPLDDLPY